MEVNGIAGNTDGKIRISLGIFVSLQKCFSVKNVYVDMVSLFGKISVEDGNEVIDTLGFVLA